MIRRLRHAVRLYRFLRDRSPTAPRSHILLEIWGSRHHRGVLHPS